MKTLLMNTLFHVVLGSFAFAQQTPVTPFITTWQTDNPGTSANNQIIIPTTGTGYNYSVAWENVNDTTISGTDGPFAGDATLTFPQAGTYRVGISGDFPRIFFNLTGDREKLLTIEQWGSNPWQSMGSAFSGCSNLTIPAQDVPNLANVTNMSRMFLLAASFNQPIGNWDVSNVTDMSGTFANATSFNQPIGNWDVSNVTNMSRVFEGASSFNQPIGNWDVSGVTDMSIMFLRASAFNQDIGAWNVQNVTNMAVMFALDSAFNQDISAWNVENVTSMSLMFRSATDFNQDISAWNVQNVRDMVQMFFGATAFNQNIGRWNIEKVSSLDDMLDDSGLSIANYDSTLIGWASLPSLQNNVPFGAGGLSYCNGEAARDSLINLYNWTITDAGRLCPTALARVDSKAIGIKKQEERLTDITVYPNPATDQFITVFPQALEAPAHWVLTDPMGKEVATGSLEEGTASQVTSTHTLTSGTYLYRLIIDGDMTATNRIVITR